MRSRLAHTGSPPRAHSLSQLPTEAGGGEVAEVDVAERVGEVADLVVFGAVRVDADEGEAEPWAAFLPVRTSVRVTQKSSAPAIRPLTSMNIEVAVGGAGSDVVAGVVVRHLAAGRGRARVRRPGRRRRRGGRIARCPWRCAAVRRQSGRGVGRAGPAG